MLKKFVRVVLWFLLVGHMFVFVLGVIGGSCASLKGDIQEIVHGESSEELLRDRAVAVYIVLWGGIGFLVSTLLLYFTYRYWR